MEQHFGTIFSQIFIEFFRSRCSPKFGSAFDSTFCSHYWFPCLCSPCLLHPLHFCSSWPSSIGPWGFGALGPWSLGSLGPRALGSVGPFGHLASSKKPWGPEAWARLGRGPLCPLAPCVLGPWLWIKGILGPKALGLLALGLLGA